MAAELRAAVAAGSLNPDILHVSSYVWRAAKVFHAQREHQEAFARDRLLRILQGEVRGVVAGLRQTATKRRLKKKDREEIATVCGYFEKHAQPHPIQLLKGSDSGGLNRRDLPTVPFVRPRPLELPQPPNSRCYCCQGHVVIERARLRFRSNDVDPTTRPSLRGDYEGIPSPGADD